MFARPRPRPVQLSDVYIGGHATEKDERGGRPYTTFQIISSTADGRQFTVHRRYRQFSQLHSILTRAFPQEKIKLPGKRLFGSNFSAEFLLERQRLLSNYLVHVLRRPNLRGLRIVSEFLTLPEWSGSGVVQAATGQPARELIKNRRKSNSKNSRRLSKSPLGSGGTASDIDDDEDDADDVYSKSLRELADLRMPAAVREAVERERGIGQNSSGSIGPAYMSIVGGAGLSAPSLVSNGGGGGGGIGGGGGGMGGSAALPSRSLSSSVRTLPSKSSSMSLSVVNGGAAGAVVGGAEVQELDRSRLFLDAEFEWREIGRKCGGMFRSNLGRTERVTVFVMAPGLVVSTRHWWMERAQVVARMNSDNVLRLIGAVTSEDPHLYVQEVGVHGTLNAMLREWADPPSHVIPASPARLARLCEGVGRGLEYLHERHGFVHGGISSYAVEVGRHDTPKLAVLDTDFGVSPQRWSAPSLLYGASLVAAHDVWAFGVLCIEVFSSGALPYPDMTEDEVYTHVMAAYNNRVTGGRDSVALASPETKTLLQRPLDCPEVVWETVIVPCLYILDSVRPTISSLLPALSAAIKVLPGGADSVGGSDSVGGEDISGERVEDQEEAMSELFPQLSTEQSEYASATDPVAHTNGTIARSTTQDTVTPDDEAVVSVWAAARMSLIEEMPLQKPPAEQQHLQHAVYEDEGEW